MILEGNKVIVRCILRGRYSGALMGIGLTDKKVVVSEVWIAHLSSGQSKEQRRQPVISAFEESRKPWNEALTCLVL